MPQWRGKATVVTLATAALTAGLTMTTMTTAGAAAGNGGCENGEHCYSSDHANSGSSLTNDNEAAFAPAAAGQFRLPFPCGETWEAGTRTNHNPQNAVDFNHYPEDLGWKVYASASGTVSKVADTGNTSYGRYIVIDHSGGWQTLYAHLRSQDVSVGQSVTTKTMIGRVGSTGGSTGPHLHYEQKRDGTVQKVTFQDGDPVYWGTKNLERTADCP